MKSIEEIESMNLREFILFVHGLTTLEFCEWQGLQPPTWTGDVKTSADLFLQIESIKARLFVEKAKKAVVEEQINDGEIEKMFPHRIWSTIPHIRLAEAKQKGARKLRDYLKEHYTINKIQINNQQ